jgi:hypothetical protein
LEFQPHECITYSEQELNKLNKVLKSKAGEKQQQQQKTQTKKKQALLIWDKT